MALGRSRFFADLQRCDHRTRDRGYWCVHFRFGDHHAPPSHFDEEIHKHFRARPDRPGKALYRRREHLERYGYLSGTEFRLGQNLHNPRITLSIVNYGRTPGNIEFAAMRVQVSAEIPKEMTRLHLITANPPANSVEIIIAAGKSFSFPEFRCDPRFTYANRTSIHTETHRLYCHGLFTYRDIFGNSHTTKFCRRYLRERNEWPPDGGSERNRSNSGRLVASPFRRSVSGGIVNYTAG